MEDHDLVDVQLEQIGGSDDVKGEDDDKIQIVIKNTQGEEMAFKVKKTTPFSKVIDAYASRQGVDSKTFKFIFDGQRVQRDDTPKTVSDDFILLD